MPLFARKQRLLIIPVYIVCVLGLLLALPPPSAQAQRGALVMPQNLGQLVDEAAVIVRGHVVSAQVEKHPQFEHLDTVVVTLKVSEVLKGSAGETFTFRQYIWDVRDRYDAAGYKKGQHLLLMMIKPSPYGLSSPAGLEQGRFRILRNRQGKEYAVNGHGNAGLFRDLEPQLTARGVRLTPRLATLVAEHKSGPLELDQLQEIIRTLAGTN